MNSNLVIVRAIGGALLLSLGAVAADAPPQVVPSPAPAAAPAPTPAPPPSAPPKRSAAELEKLAAPIALYPDPLVATILPASVYPLEIVQAARFVKDTNNLARLDAQPWDENVKAVARIPAVIQKMNDDLQWTIELGEAFLAQDKELMAAVQNLRLKAQKAGTLQSTPQQAVVVTNMLVEKTVEQQVVVVTNTVVQIQSSNPEVIYVPQYNPAVVYAPPPTYVYDPVAPLVTFGVGMAVGAVIANNCDWHGGGVYVGHHGVAVWGGGGYHGDVDIDVNRNVNVNNSRNANINQRTAQASTSATQQKWQPNQSRLSTSGASGTSASADTRQARGWGSGTTPTSAGASGTRPSAGSAAAKPSTVPSSGSARPAASPAASRPTPSPSASSPRPSPAVSRPSSGGSAFSGMSSGAGARDYASRGAASRGGGFGGGGRGGGRR